MSEKAVWSAARINGLPDAAFAYIEPGGEKDEDGKTVPRTLRHLPHHTESVKSATENSSVDLPHLRAALSRVNQIPQAGRAAARSHLQRHAKALLGKSDETIIRKHWAFDIKSINEDERSADFVASTTARDSYGDVVRQHWDLSHFDKNPAVLFGHNRYVRRPAEAIPVAYSKEHGVKGGKLQFTPVFSDDQANPDAERVWQGVLQKVLRATSVGFRPGKIVREEDENGVVTFYVGTKDQPNVLKEISIVPLGANHEAVAKDVGSEQQTVAEAYERQLVADGLKEFDEEEDHPALQLAARSTSNQESNMDPKELEAQLAEANAKVETLSGELKSKTDELESQSEAHTAEVASLKEVNESLTTELASAKEKMAQIEKDLDDEKTKSAKLDEQLVSLEVDKYIGKKITPAEREQAVADRKRDGSKAFDERMSRRPDLNLTTTTTPAEKVQTTTAATKQTAGSKLAEGMRAVEHKA